MQATRSLGRLHTLTAGAALLVALGCWSASAEAQDSANANPLGLFLNQEPQEDPAPDARAPRREGPLEGRGHGARPAGRGGRGLERGIWRRLSDEERTELYEFVQENFPELHKELETLRQDQARQFQRRMARLAPKLLDLLDLMEIDPERGKLAIKEHKLEIQLRVLLLQYHKSQDESERAELRALIRPAVEKKLECRQQRHEQEIRDLEARITHLRKRLEQAAANRDKLVERALERLLSEPPPEKPAERGFRGKRRDQGRGKRGRLGPPPDHEDLEPPPPLPEG